MCEHFDRALIHPDGRVDVWHAMPWQVYNYAPLRRAFLANPARCCELAQRATRWNQRYPEYRKRIHG